MEIPSKLNQSFPSISRALNIESQYKSDTKYENPEHTQSIIPENK